LYVACITASVGGKVTKSVTRAMMFVVLSDIAEIEVLVTVECWFVRVWYMLIVCRRLGATVEL
jgi:hypothetical protein